MALKKKNPDLKILLAVGGWNHEDDATSKKVSQLTRRSFRRDEKSSLYHVIISTENLIG